MTISEVQRQCGAKTRAGTPCRMAPMPNNRCYKHGGATPSGMSSPHFKHGRYSKNLPAQIASRYEEAERDRRLLHLRDEIALVDAFVDNALRKAEPVDASWLLKELRKAWKKLEKARRGEDAAAEGRALHRLAELITAQQEGTPAWEEQVLKLLDQRLKLVESERKRVVEARQVISIEEAMVLFAALADAVRLHVTDLTILVRIDAEFQRIVHKQGR